MVLASNCLLTAKINVRAPPIEWTKLYLKQLSQDFMFEPPQIYFFFNCQRILQLEPLVMHWEMLLQLVYSFQDFEILFVWTYEVISQIRTTTY